MVKACHGFSALPASKMEAKTDVNIPGVYTTGHTFITLLLINYSMNKQLKQYFFMTTINYNL